MLRRKSGDSKKYTQLIQGVDDSIERHKYDSAIKLIELYLKDDDNQKYLAKHPQKSDELSGKYQTAQSMNICINFSKDINASIASLNQQLQSLQDMIDKKNPEREKVNTVVNLLKKEIKVLKDKKPEERAQQLEGIRNTAENELPKPDKKRNSISKAEASALKKWISLANESLDIGDLSATKYIVSSIANAINLGTNSQVPADMAAILKKGGLSETDIENLNQSLNVLNPFNAQKFSQSIKVKLNSEGKPTLPDLLVLSTKAEGIKSSLDSVLDDLASISDQDLLQNIDNIKQSISQTIEPYKAFIAKVAPSSTAMLIQSTENKTPKARTQSADVKRDTWQAPSDTRGKARSAPTVIGRRKSTEQEAAEKPEPNRARRNAKGEQEAKRKPSGLNPATGLPFDDKGAKPPRKSSDERSRANSSSDKENSGPEKEDTPTPNRPRR